MNLELVRYALTLPRPGGTVQVRMSPQPRPGAVRPHGHQAHLRQAAVMILLYPRTGQPASVKVRNAGEHGPDDPAQLSAQPADALDFILTRRTETVETHKGQISLPGGAQEEQESLEQTALREAAEELGIDRACVEILGAPLSAIDIPVSGFRATPFVGFTPARPNLVPAADEVVEIIEAPLDVIVGEAHVVREQWNIRDTVCQVPFYAVGAHKVWGATAMILAEFGEMLNRAERS